MYKHILFDLDGTLTDPAEGITNSVKYALRKAGIPVPSPETLLQFIGPPLYESFQRITGLSESQAMECVAFYREYFPERGMFENALIPGVPEMLAELRAAGLHLHLATAKPEVYAVPILRHFGLYDNFVCIGAASLDKSRARKEQVIAYTLAQLGEPERSECVMVGDRRDDVLGAKLCGMDCIGVLFGYGSAAELLKAGAAALAETPAQVVDMIMKR